MWQRICNQKSHRKIANLMKPQFGNDENKIKTFYCRVDCKVKVMIKAMFCGAKLD